MPVERETQRYRIRIIWLVDSDIYRTMSIYWWTSHDNNPPLFSIRRIDFAMRTFPINPLDLLSPHTSATRIFSFDTSIPSPGFEHGPSFVTSITDSATIRKKIDLHCNFLSQYEHLAIEFRFVLGKFYLHCSFVSQYEHLAIEFRFLLGKFYSHCSFVSQYEHLAIEFRFLLGKFYLHCNFFSQYEHLAIEFRFVLGKFYLHCSFASQYEHLAIEFRFLLGKFYLHCNFASQYEHLAIEFVL